MSLDYVIVVIDRNPRRFPPARELIEAGLPLKVAERWRVERRKITRDLKRRVRESVN